MVLLWCGMLQMSVYKFIYGYIMFSKVASYGLNPTKTIFSYPRQILELYFLTFIFHNTILKAWTPIQSSIVWLGRTREKKSRRRGWKKRRGYQRMFFCYLSRMTYIWSKFLDYQQCCALLVVPQQLREDSLKMFLYDECVHIVLPHEY